MSGPGIFWITVTIISLLLYGVTAMVVSVFGFVDLIKMFRYLDRLHKEETNNKLPV